MSGCAQPEADVALLDTTPNAFVVVATTPREGAVMNKAWPWITATFSTDVDPSTVAGGILLEECRARIVVRRPGCPNWRASRRVSGVTSFDGDRTLRFTPTAALALRDRFYRVTVLDTVADRDGTRLASEFRWVVRGTDVPAPATFAVRAGGALADEGSAIDAYPDGSAVVTGYFYPPSTFGDVELTGVFADVFVAKIDASGSWTWVSTAGGSGGDYGQEVGALVDGGAIVAGSFGKETSESATFGSTTLTPAGEQDVFVAKVDAGGDWVWAVAAGATKYAHASALTVLDDGGAIVAGMFFGSVSFGSTTLVSSGGGDGFVAKIAHDGSWLWAVRVDAMDVSALDHGGAVVLGVFTGVTMIGGTELVSHGGRDIFVAEVGADGSWRWATSIGSAADDWGRALGAVDATGVILAGSVGASTSVSGPNVVVDGAFVAKVDRGGAWQWATPMGAVATSIASVGDGGAILAGTFTGTAMFAETTLNSVGTRNLFAAKVDGGGAIEWAAQSGTASVGSVAGLADGSGIIAGGFSGTMAFGEVTLTSLDDDDFVDRPDVFVAKIHPDGRW
jgi:hypothetical protein